MSTSSRDLWLEGLWDEWLSSPAKNPDAEISGLLCGMRYHHGAFITKRLKAARRLTVLWKISSYRDNPCHVSMLTSPDGRVSVKLSCCPEARQLNKTARWSWLKGLWGSTGALYFPRYGYYLSLRSNAEALNFTGLAWTLHRHENVLRNHEDIMTFLYEAGMVRSSLEFDAIVMIKSARNRANVMMNYEVANIARSVEASSIQTEIIQKVITSGKLPELPCDLRDLVEKRLKYPDYTLSELGQALQRPVSKSTVNYRLKKLRNLASTITTN